MKNTIMTINMGIDIEKKICVANVKGDTKLILMEDKFQRTTFGIRYFAEKVMKEYPEHFT